MGGLFGGGAAQASAEPEVTVEELRAFCPRVGVVSSGAVWSQYESGGEGDAARLVQRSSISDVTRACTYGSDTMTVNVAIAGRVIPGPVGRAGTVTLPIIIEARRGDEVLYQNRANFPVQVGDVAGATQFVFNDPNVTIPQAGVQQVQIFARLAQPGE